MQATTVSFRAFPTVYLPGGFQRASDGHLDDTDTTSAPCRRRKSCLLSVWQWHLAVGQPWGPFSNFPRVRKGGVFIIIGGHCLHSLTLPWVLHLLLIPVDPRIHHYREEAVTFFPRCHPMTGVITFLHFFKLYGWAVALILL